VPTEEKVKEVELLRELFESCTSAVSADYTGMSVQATTALRHELREKGIRFRVVKNSLVYLAADAAGQPAAKDMVAGPVGIAFGFDDPVGPAKALTQFIRTTGSPMAIRGGLLGGRALSAAEVADLAALPPKDQMIARLAGQLNGPITGLVYVLSAPVAGLARVLQRRIESVEEGPSGQDTEITGADRVEDTAAEA